MGKRKRHYKAKNVGKGAGGRLNQTVTARKSRARPIEQQDEWLDGWVNNPAKFLLYTFAFGVVCFLIKWLL